MMSKRDKFSERKNAGAIGGIMRSRVKNHTKHLSVRTRRNYLRACKSFDDWRKRVGVSNKNVAKEPVRYVGTWRDYLLEQGYSTGTIHTYIAGVCCGLAIPMSGITRSGTSLDKRKSLGTCARAQRALLRSQNADIVAFQAMVGGRRAALQRLTGSDFLLDESGQWCVRFVHDKGGKSQLQRIAPEDVGKVKAYFDSVAPDALVFPHQIDRNLDLHGLRAEHARQEYERYAKICATPEGRTEMRRQLWARYKDPIYGCKAWLSAQQRGDQAGMRHAERAFVDEMADGIYYLQRANRKIALERGRSVGYDRLALCCVSVFALSHWRNEVTVKHYML